MESHSLENDLICVGTMPGQTTVYGKPFPLVLTPRAGKKLNFIHA
jgi:hypothetical protein